MSSSVGGWHLRTVEENLYYPEEYKEKIRFILTLEGWGEDKHAGSSFVKEMTWESVLVVASMKRLANARTNGTGFTNLSRMTAIEMK